MKNKNIIFLAMLVLAIFAVGSVSAADDIATDIDESTDDIVMDDVDVDVTDEINEEVASTSYTPYTITTSSNFTDINAKISDGTYDGYEFVFENDTYTNFAMVTGNNNKFTGNGATIIGSTDNLFTVAGSNNIVITGFNMQVATGKAAIYGANVFNAEITNNTITGGKDGINIMQTHDNITISGNTITGVTRDAISLVDHRTLSDTEWDNRGNSVISNNIISGSSEYGMFFGGNFNGIVTDNTINVTGVGMEFAGKKAATNGRLSVDIMRNTISNVQSGINMFHPGVEYLYLSLNTIDTLDNSTNFAISISDNFSLSTYGFIYAYGNYLHGKLNQTFINNCLYFSGNYGYDIVN